MASTTSDDLAVTLEQLTAIPGLAGHEQRVARFMRSQMEPNASSISTDALGNVIATVEGRSSTAPSTMLFAHMDSLGFVVRNFDDGGYIKVVRLGGIPEKVLPATPVTITTDSGRDVPGIIGIKAHHVTPLEEKRRVTPLDELFIDIGANSRDEVRASGIQTGDPVTYTGAFRRLANDKVSATFIDNRAGCLVLLETLRRLGKNRPAGTVHFVATVQEEFNLRGAAPVAEVLKPDVAICIDGTVPGDTPDLSGSSDVVMGGGPAINLYSFHGRGTLNGLIPHPALVRGVTSCAEEQGLPLQRNLFFGGLTDASYVQLENGGIPTVDVAYPMRYAHSPSEMCHLGDLQGLIELLSTFIPQLDEKFDLSR